MAGVSAPCPSKPLSGALTARAIPWGAATRPPAYEGPEAKKAAGGHDNHRRPSLDLSYPSYPSYLSYLWRYLLSGTGVSSAFRSPSA